MHYSRFIEMEISVKVLLLGEYSGFYYSLKRGLQELGVEVYLKANGDDFKNIPGADKLLYKDAGSNKISRGYNRIIMPELNKGDMQGYDVVQMVHDILYSPYINSHMVNYLKKKNGKVFTNITGNHYSLYQSWLDKKLEYYTYDDNPDKYKIFLKETDSDRRYVESSKYVDSVVDGIIPTTYEYAIGVRDYKNVKKTIPLPMNCNGIDYEENKINGKLFFYHGLLRPLDKGGKYIAEALKIIKDKYPNDVDICVADTLPLNEYLEVLKKTNVLVDQCKEHCWGMNTCYGMAMGKVVMGGASDKSLEEYGLTESPIVHITPNVDQIVSQLEYVIENRNNITEWGYKSRKFVEEFHDSKRIAQMYLDTWKE